MFYLPIIDTEEGPQHVDDLLAASLHLIREIPMVEGNGSVD